MKKTKKILVVGGTGFIGFYLSKRCLTKKWKVVSFSINLPRKIRHLQKVKYLTGDLSKKKDLKILNQSFDYVGLRYMNVYGSRQDYQGAYIAVIMKILDRLDKGLPLQ